MSFALVYLLTLIFYMELLIMLKDEFIKRAKDNIEQKLNELLNLLETEK